MTIRRNFPFDEVSLDGTTTSIATTPVSINFVSPISGWLCRGYVNAFGTTTGTVTCAVKINGGATDVFNGGLTLPAGSGTANNPGVDIPLVGAGTTSGVYVSEGDAVVCSFSGGTGASIPGAVSLMLRLTD
jgi:hypothetical protein